MYFTKSLVDSFAALSDLFVAEPFEGLVSSFFPRFEDEPRALLDCLLVFEVVNSVDFVSLCFFRTMLPFLSSVWVEESGQVMHSLMLIFFPVGISIEL